MKFVRANSDFKCLFVTSVLKVLHMFFKFLRATSVLKFVRVLAVFKFVRVTAVLILYV